MSLAALAALALLTQVPTRGPEPAALTPDAPPPSARIAGIHVRGNHTTPDSDIIRIAGVAVGDPFIDSILDAVRSRLERSGQFRHVDVLRRYGSLSDLSAILLVIVVEERVAVTVAEVEPGPLRRLRANTMWLPLLQYEDGYGFTYGARVGVVDMFGRHTRVSAPFTWGGERRAAVEVEQTFSRGPFSRVRASAGVWRRVHPALDLGDRRAGGMLLADRALTSWLRVAATASATDIHFGTATDSLATVGVGATLDTRRDPAFPRNAVFACVGWERLWFGRASDTSRLNIDVRGFLGLVGPTVLAVRVQEVRPADPVPVFEQALLGGSSSLRGFRLGFRYGDRLTAASLEMRIPISSPRHVGRAGVAVFVDRGAVYDTQTSLADARLDTGIGAGWFVQAPVLSFRIDVAHGLDAGTRAHVTLGVTF